MPWTLDLPWVEAWGPENSLHPPGCTAQGRWKVWASWAAQAWPGAGPWGRRGAGTGALWEEVGVTSEPQAGAEQLCRESGRNAVLESVSPGLGLELCILKLSHTVQDGWSPYFEGLGHCD